MFIARATNILFNRFLTIVFLCAGLMISSLILANDTEQNTVKGNTAGSAFIVDKTNDTGMFGRALSVEEINALDTHIFPEGEQLPDGEGTFSAGKSIYQEQCASCHGGMGEGAVAVELVGDRSLLTTAYPDKGIGVYWPFAPTLFQYIQRAMPPENPGLLTDTELYSLIFYLLYLNNLLPESGKLDQQTLADIKLPNRDGFVDQYMLVPRSENN